MLCVALRVLVRRSSVREVLRVIDASCVPVAVLDSSLDLLKLLLRFREGVGESDDDGALLLLAVEVGCTDIEMDVEQVEELWAVSECDLASRDGDIDHVKDDDAVKENDVEWVPSLLHVRPEPDREADVEVV